MLSDIHGDAATPPSSDMNSRRFIRSLVGQREQLVGHYPSERDLGMRLSDRGIWAAIYMGWNTPGVCSAPALLSVNRTVTCTPSSSREVVIEPGALAASRSMLVLRGRISETNPRTPRLIAYSWRRACRAVPRPTP